MRVCRADISTKTIVATKKIHPIFSPLPQAGTSCSAGMAATSSGVSVRSLVKSTIVISCSSGGLFENLKE